MIFTIGHSNLSQNTFQDLLRQHQVELIADVRSNPNSRFLPHFNRNRLDQSEIPYIFLGDQLGGRPRKSTLYTNGQADYRLMAQEPEFTTSIERLQHLAQDRRIALLCSEGHPENCHRALLVAHQLHLLGEEPLHIEWGTCEPTSHRQLLDTLMKLHATGDWEQALLRQARKVAYRAR